MTWERCSCNAAIFTFSAKRADKWRTTHIHEVQPEPEYSDQPTVVESASTNERIGDEFPAQERALIGFQRNEIGGRA